MKLSKAQQKAIKKMSGKWQTAYELQIGLNTLDALHAKQLADRKLEQGYTAFPRTSILYRLSDEGIRYNNE